jgi:dTDP-4-amino-4,6-dideoxygalactose transaminase
VTSRIEFVDLGAQRERLAGRIEAAIARVLEHGRFIMGPEVVQLEDALATYCSAPHVVSCASGTDALVLALMALGVGPGRSVLVPTFTFASTAEAVALVGATPAFVDVSPDTFNMSPDGIRATVEAALASGAPPVGMIIVDLFGQPADYPAVREAAEESGLWVIADAAQSFGAELDGQRVGTLAPITTTSFFPAKPLGCYGDGGAVMCADSDLAGVLRSLRVHGQGDDKYDNVRIGINGRLDTLQAAILLEKLSIFDEELGARRALANRYTEGLAGDVTCPSAADGAASSWAQYTIVMDERDRVSKELATCGIPTAVYYPRPLHAQPAYRDAICPSGGLPVAARLADQVLSLPMHPYLDRETADRIIEAVKGAVS